VVRCLSISQSKDGISCVKRSVASSKLEPVRQNNSRRDHILYQRLSNEDDIEEDVTDKVFKSLPRPDKMELSIHNRLLFLVSFAIVEAIGIASIAMTIHWVVEYKKGVEWSFTDYGNGKGIGFNWHPILMSLGLIFLYGNGAMIYRLIPPKNESQKLGLKIGHAVTMMVVFVLMVVGLQAAFDSHNLKGPPPTPNMYTLHSWIGLMAALLFGIQWALGFSAFLFPKFSPNIRAIILPFHQYFGSSILVLSVAAACLGHLEKALWSITTPVYASKNAESQLVNWTGIMYILYAMGITFLLSKFSKTPPEITKQ